MFKTVDFQEPEDLFHRAEKIFQEEKPKPEKKNFTLLFAILLILLISSPLIFLGINFSLSAFRIKQIQKSVQAFDLVRMRGQAKSLEKSLGRDINFLEVSNSLLGTLGFQEEFSKIQNLLLFGKITSESLYELAEVSLGGEKILKKVLSGEEISLKEDLSEISLGIDKVYEKTSYAQGLLDEFSGKEPLVGPYFLKAAKILPELRKNLIIAREVIDIIPQALGTKERKTYLVLFQNNMEIRPTGGFIGSFGLLTFERGRLLDFEIQDVYFADGQLKGHVEPPAKLREFLGTAGWYLRDSNWDPDFPASAERAAWFLDKEIGRTIDGVIGINLTVAQRILESVGEIELPDYPEKISAKNFFERAEYFSEAGFFPGSTGKQDFLGQVGRVLFEKIKNSDEKTSFLIARAFLASLEEKDMTIFLKDPLEASVLAKFNWDGGIKNVKCQISNVKCLTDYLFLVEANVGVNKSNYFLKRSLEQTVKIGQDGKISEYLIINYENQSPSEIFPAGRYKNYLRIYVPKGSTLGECKIDSEECKIDQTEEHQRTVFGFLVEVPVGEKQKVEISWGLPNLFEKGEYVLLFQKQSGSARDNLSLSISYPKNLTLMETQPSALTGTGIIIYNTNLSRDLVFRLNFSKK